MTERPGLSRRRFLQGVGAGAIAAGALPGLVNARAAQDAQGRRGPFAGPGAVPITLNVNGRDRALEVEPRVTLLDALRNRLEITGAKKVCDRATCGACTVLIDGKAVYACTVLAIAAQGRRIETVESLAHEGDLAPIQRAFVANDAQQCGFCTPGFVVASEALLREHATPTAAQIDDALGGNLCRCGTYVGLRAACSSAGGPARRAEGR